MIRRGEGTEMNQKTEKEFSIDCDGIRLHAKLDYPEGFEEKCPLMLLFHGFTGHMEERHILAIADTALEEGMAVLRVDSYGHGKSEGEFRNHTLYKWVTGALTAVDYAKQLDFVTDLYLCGHSQGGLLVALVAGMCQDVFKAVIPMSPALMIPENARHGSLLGQSFDPVHIPDTLVSWDGRELDGNYVRVAQTIHVEDEIDRYQGPVCLIHGDADEAVPLECSVQAAKRYANAVLEVIPGDTHCYDYHLELVCEKLKAFLEKTMKG